MADLTLSGLLHEISDTQTFDSGFTKRNFVLKTDEMYPQEISMDFLKDKTKLLDLYKVGDKVEVGINLRGNEYNGKRYVSVNAWKISKVETPSATKQDDLPY